MVGLGWTPFQKTPVHDSDTSFLLRLSLGFTDSSVDTFETLENLKSQIEMVNLNKNQKGDFISQAHLHSFMVM